MEFPGEHYTFFDAEHIEGKRKRGEEEEEIPKNWCDLPNEKKVEIIRHFSSMSDFEKIYMLGGVDEILAKEELEKKFPRKELQFANWSRGYISKDILHAAGSAFIGGRSSWKMYLPYLRPDYIFDLLNITKRELLSFKDFPTSQKTKLMETGMFENESDLAFEVNSYRRNHIHDKIYKSSLFTRVHCWAITIDATAIDMERTYKLNELLYYNMLVIPFIGTDKLHWQMYDILRSKIFDPESSYNSELMHEIAFHHTLVHKIDEPVEFVDETKGERGGSVMTELHKFIRYTVRQTEFDEKNLFKTRVNIMPFQILTTEKMEQLIQEVLKTAKTDESFHNALYMN